MDSNDTMILALALGIPSATLLSIAFLLALRIQHRQLLARGTPNPTVPTNSPVPSPPPVDPYYGIPLKQRPPRIIAPLPYRPIPINDFARVARSEEVRTSESSAPVIPEERPPAPPRRRKPIIILSPSISTQDPTHAPRSPTPGEYAHYRSNGRGFDVGRDLRVTAPHDTCDHTWDADPPAPLAPVSPNEFWDNITIPYSAYFPAPHDGSPNH